MRGTAIALCFALALSSGSAAVLGASDARQNMEIVNRSIAAEFGEALEPSVPGKLCTNDNYCNGLNSEVLVTTMGQRVDVSPSKHDTIEFYHRTCSAILSGLGDIHPESARQYMAELFNAAAQHGGDAQADISGVDARVRPSYDDRLQCEFIKW
jgi:hypothetical protein